MEEMHRMRYVGKGVELLSPLQASLSLSHYVFTKLEAL